MKCLTDLRKSKKMTVSQMAKLLGVPESLYSKIEYGARQPSRVFMQKFKMTFPEFDMNIFFAMKLHETCNNKTTA